MLRKLGLIFAALALFSIAGGHWAVLQTVAWAEMLHDCGQRTGSLAVAAEQTFDGQHPCELCLQIAAAREREAKSQSEKPFSDQKTGKAQKNDKALALEKCLFPAWTLIASVRWDPLSPLDGPSRDEQPPTPPPRRFRA